MVDREEKKDWDLEQVKQTTDRFSEIVFELSKVCSQLKSSSNILNNLHSDDYVDGTGNLWKQLKSAEQTINNKIKDWEDDPIFCSEIKLRLEVLELQKKYIRENLESIGRSISSIVVSFDGLGGKGIEK